MKRIFGAIALVTGVVLVILFAGRSDVVAAQRVEPTIRLVSQNPWVTPGGSFIAVVQLDNAPVGGRLVPTVHRPVPTRSAFALTLQGRDLPPVVATLSPHAIVRADSQVMVRFTTAGQDANPDPADDIDRVDLPSAGVYPIVWTLQDADGAPVTEVVSYAMRLPASQPDGASGRIPLQVATEFRLGGLPRIDKAGALVAPEGATSDAAALTDGLADADRSSRASFAYAITPALAEALGADPDRDSIDDLASLTDAAPLQRGGWAPFDLADWLATPGLVTSASRMTERGTASLTRHLHRPITEVTDLDSWGTAVTPEELRWLHERGSAAFLVPPGKLAPLDEDRFPRTLAAPFQLRLGDDEIVTAMQLDAKLASHFDAEDPVLGANRLLADLAVIALDLPAMKRGVVVASPIGWSPSAAFLSAYANGLNEADPPGADPLVAPTPLIDVVQHTPPARAAGDLATDGEVLHRSLRGSQAAKPLGGLATLRKAAEAQIDSLASMVPGGTDAAATIIEPLRDRVDLASASGVTSERRKAAFAKVDRQVVRRAESLELPARQTITLTSQDASLPFTIRRPADGPTLVRVHIDARSRLDFPDGVSRLVRLDEPITHLDIRVHSDSPGDDIVRVTVTSPDGGLTSGTTEMVVRSTAASGVGLIISFGSLAFLFVWWGRDIVRARRRHHANRVPPAELIEIE